MENKEFERIVEEVNNNYDISSRIYWRNPEEWAEQIRQEEREKIFWERHIARERKRRAYQQKRDNFICSLPLRILGLLMLAISLTYVVAAIDRDCTFLLITIPISLFLIICPGYNKTK